MTRLRIRIAFLLATTAIGHICAAANLSGNWVATIATSRAPEYARVSLHEENGNLTGSWGELKLTGTVAGEALQLNLRDSSDQPGGRLTGTVSGDSIRGTGSISAPFRPGAAMEGMARSFRGSGGGGPIEFTLTRAVVAPDAPRDIHFEPTDLIGYYSAANKPALHIFPGDVVHTWTADAGGVDAKGVQHRGGDSNIGPFYVEGALPGDTLVVHLLKVRTNRATARQGHRLNANAVTTAYLLGAKYDNSVDGQWTILPDKGIAVPAHPSEHMKNYSVPLRPMLGCISVAPPGDQQYRGGDLGPFGGNMDYNDNAEGTTLYFPIFHPGALLGMGDGHAAMGDGEVVGSGLETSMDVDFSVEVIPGDATTQVRAETSDYLIAFGVTGSVPESIQVATSELAKWIKKDYKLSDSEVALLFAATLKYDITELVDARYNIAAKVPKSVLSTMR
ncbi:MAG TPA: acetamidase/formamidase family protein [Terracidiphilus sp.]|jgi:acetamidase/formamidase|nr:acetamidase/formamidase family protein [Terracidiphilus sp.]